MHAAVLHFFEKVIETDIGTVNDIIDTVFEQVSTSFSLKETIGLASGLTEYQCFKINRHIVFYIKIQVSVQHSESFFRPSAEIG